MFFHPSTCCIHLGNASEPLLRADDLSMLVRSRMPGVLGLSVKTRELVKDELELLAREIAHYKRLRPILQEGSVTLLTAQVPRSGSVDWDALQVTSATTGDAIVFAFAAPEAPDRTTVRPQGLDPAAPTGLFDRLTTRSGVSRTGARPDEQAGSSSTTPPLRHSTSS